MNGFSDANAVSVNPRSSSIDRLANLLDHIGSETDEVDSAAESPSRFVENPRSSLEKWAEQMAGLMAGRFAIQSELGNGAFGSVIAAFDLKHRRDVALKLPHMHLCSRVRFVARLQREIVALAMLDHPGIVRLLDSVVGDNAAILVLERVDGPTLAAWMKDRMAVLRDSKPDALARTLNQRIRAAVRFILQILGALASAHEKGIVHRDVKPANILMEPLNCAATPKEASLEVSPLEFFRPRLADFGLAKLAVDQVGLTESRAIVGSLYFMAPEQAAGRADLVGTASDVYSMGRILEEILNIERGGKGLALALPADLLAIRDRCIQIDPKLRYPDAAAFADDLIAWLEGRQTVPCSPSTQRTTRRGNWKLATAVACVAGAFYFVGPRVSKQPDSVVANPPVLVADPGLEKLHYAVEIPRINEQVRAGLLAEARSALVALRERSNRTDFLWQRLWQQSEFNDLLMPGHRGPVYSLQYSRSGDLLLSAGADGTVRLWNTKNNREIQTLRGHTDECNLAVFSPDQKQIASASDDGTIRLWDVAGQRPNVKLLGHRGEVYSLAYSRDGKSLLSGGDNREAIIDQRILLWDLQHHTLVREIQASNGKVDDLALSHDEELLSAVLSDRGLVIFKNWRRGPAEIVYQASVCRSNGVWWSKARKISYKGLHGFVTVDLANASARPTEGILRDSADVGLVSLTYDDRLAAFNSYGRTVVWDLKEDVWAGAHFSKDRTWSMAIAPNGQELAFAPDKGTLVRRKTPLHREFRRVVVNQPGRCVDGRLSPDGRWATMISGGDRPELYLYDLVAGERRLTMPLAKPGDFPTAFSPSMSRAILVASPNLLSVFDLKTGRLTTTVLPRDGSFSAAQFLSEDQIAIVDNKQRCIRSLRLSGIDKPERETLLQDPLPTSLSLSKVSMEGDGEALVGNQFITRYHLGSRQEIWSWRDGRGACSALCRSHDGQRVAVGMDPSPLAILNWHTGREESRVENLEGVASSVAFSGDDRLLAVGTNTGSVKLFDVATGLELVTLSRDLGSVAALGFDSKGQCLIAIVNRPGGSHDILAWEAVGPSS